MPRGSSKKFFLFGLPGGGGISTASLGVVDSFTDTTGVALTSHVPDQRPSGSSWSYFQDAGATVAQITSNQLQFTTPNAGQNGFAAIDSKLSDCTILLTCATYGITSNNDPGIYFRVQDSANWWRWLFSAGTVYLQRRVAGSTSTIGTAALTATNGDIYKVVLAGTSIQAFLNGTLKVSTADSFNQAKTIHGVAVGATATRLDDFSAK